MKRAAPARATFSVLAAALALSAGAAASLPPPAYADTASTEVVLPAPDAAVDRAADIVGVGTDGVLVQEEGTAGYEWISTANRQISPVPALDGVPREAIFRAYDSLDRIAYTSTGPDGGNEVVWLSLKDGTSRTIPVPAGYTRLQASGGFVLAVRTTGDGGTEYRVLRPAVGDGVTDTAVTLPAGATPDPMTEVPAQYGTQLVVRWQQDGRAAYGIVDVLSGSVQQLPVTGPASGFRMTKDWTLWFSREGGTAGVRVLPHGSASTTPRVVATPTTSATDDVNAYAVGGNLLWYEGAHGPLHLEPLSGSDTRRDVLADAELAVQDPDGALIALGTTVDGTRGVHDFNPDANGLVSDLPLRTLPPVVYQATTDALSLDRGTLRYTTTVRGVTTLRGKSVGTALEPVAGADLPTSDGLAPNRFADGSDRGLVRLTSDPATGKDVLTTGSRTVPLPSSGGRILDVSPSYVLYAGSDGAQSVVDTTAGRIARQQSAQAAALDYSTLWTPHAKPGLVAAVGLRNGATWTADLGSSALCTPTDLRSNGQMLYWACGPEHRAGVYDLTTGDSYYANPDYQVLLGDHFMGGYDPATGVLHLTRFLTGGGTEEFAAIHGVKPAPGDTRGVTWTIDRRSNKVAYTDTDETLHVARVDSGTVSPLTVPDYDVPSSFASKSGTAQWAATWWLSKPAASWKLTIAATSTGQAVRSWTGGATPSAVSVTWDGRTSAGALVPNGAYFWALTVTPADGQGKTLTIGAALPVSGAGAAPRDFAGPSGPDGIGDLVTLTASGTLGFQKGTGYGTFSGYVTGGGWPSTATFVPFGDVNGDHCDDVLVRLSSGTLRAYEPACGQGVSTATPYRTIGSGWNTYNLITSPGDLNGDGITDLVARDTSGVLWRYTGTGKGTFTPRVKIGAGWNIYNALVGVGDFTRDGHADVVARDTSGVLWRYTGTGTGTFATRVKIGWGYQNFRAVL